MSARGCQLTVQLDLVVEECCSCGMPFAMPKDFNQQARKDTSVLFYCPRGHNQHYTTSKTAQLEANLKAAREQLERTHARLRETQEERDHHWTERKKMNTRHRNLKKRIAHGVCPCCHRTFQNLQRHMETQHTHFAKPESKES